MFIAALFTPAKTWKQHKCPSAGGVDKDDVAHLLNGILALMLTRPVMSDSLWTLWTVAYQAPLSMGFSRQEYWSGLPCPLPGDLPDPGIEPMSPVLQADSSPRASREAPRWTTTQP